MFLPPPPQCNLQLAKAPNDYTKSATGCSHYYSNTNPNDKNFACCNTHMTACQCPRDGPSLCVACTSNIDFGGACNVDENKSPYVCSDCSNQEECNNHFVTRDGYHYNCMWLEEDAQCDKSAVACV